MKLVYRRAAPDIAARWIYSVDDEGRARWLCENCGLAIRVDPHDIGYCANCGARMRMEA